MVKTYMDVEDLDVYQRLCKLHIEVCELSHSWPQEERYELGSQIRRSSNSSPAQLAEKHDDRHVRNKIYSTSLKVFGVQCSVFSPESLRYFLNAER